MSRKEALAELVAKIERVDNSDRKKRLIMELCDTRQPTILGFVNAHAVNLAWENPPVARLFMLIDVLLRDGKGMELLDRASNREPGLNMNGTDFIPELLAETKSDRIAVFGSREPWLGAAENNLRSQGHKIVARCDGFLPVQDYIHEVRETKPSVVVLAMGMPRQEEVAIALRDALPDTPMLIVCGGAIVDFLADRFARAPVWLRRLGLEWAYRLWREPKRLFRRYVIGNMRFLLSARAIARYSRHTYTLATRTSPRG